MGAATCELRLLVAALAGEHFETADLLNGADLHVRGRYESALLHAAAISGNFEVVRILIDSSSTTPPTSMLGTRIGGHRYFVHQQFVMSKTILSYGADINAQSESGRPALHWASINGALEVVRRAWRLCAYCSNTVLMWDFLFQQPPPPRHNSRQRKWELV